jgi:NAD-dependent dihydropyrimidine dehydrogenase PreA subunit
MAFQVSVDKEKCKGCEECIEICTVRVLKMQEGKSIVVDAEPCIGCESCVGVCKEKAITVEELKTDLSETARALLRDIL